MRFAELWSWGEKDANSSAFGLPPGPTRSQADQELAPVKIDHMTGKEGIGVVIRFTQFHCQQSVTKSSHQMTPDKKPICNLFKRESAKPGSDVAEGSVYAPLPLLPLFPFCPLPQGLHAAACVRVLPQLKYWKYLLHLPRIWPWFCH